jgi:hypothetical protein
LNRLCLLGSLAALAFTGCATGNLEQDAFFNRGWLWPKDLEKPSEHLSRVNDSMPPERERD